MDGESCIRKAYEYIFHSDFEEAIYWFEQAIVAEPDNAGYYHKCAVSCARSGKWTKAKIYADVAEKLDPGNEEYRFHSQTIQSRLLLAEANGLIAEANPNLKEAAERLRHAVSLDPLSFDAYYTLAMVCHSDGLLDEAIDCAREALRLDPNHSAARRLFADISRKRRMERIRSTIRRK
ncbi:tetratricopeptide repeat protein [Paenibacillus soyae]|uniref:Tetratricopeptide repeat protein n=1 Tax=Paenibacillus soyae TaxID=2969249 RepID=A0A9X2S7E8_9BACL|nr:tetratricopeptide repeat protein [Paenibacillus soyae]MCR2802985.1 tetratricopeptide repeat protein [Paenibacillus soyae]